MTGAMIPAVLAVLIWFWVAAFVWGVAAAQGATDWRTRACIIGWPLVILWVMALLLHEATVWTARLFVRRVRRKSWQSRAKTGRVS